MQIDLTPFTLRITEDSAKQLVNSLQLTVICTIRLLREGECILCLACTFRDYYFLRKCKGTFREYYILKKRRVAV
jgi:hypothetical protein